MNWIEYKIAVPPTSGEYLCVLKGYAAKPLIEKCKYSNTTAVVWSHCGGFGNVGEHVTHWMPLPKLPE